jgi:hypothetical protein
MAIAAASESSAADLSGDYADGGTIVSADSGVAAVEPSLRALLSLQFDPAVVGALRDETSHVTIKHGGGVLEIEARDMENNVAWRGRWHEGSGYVQRGSSVLLRFRLEGSGSDEIVLTLEPLAPHGLLQVSAQRITPTLLGPVARPLGTYLFHRMP